MKAFLLAAGKGTRLRPYTDRVPKCLIPIHGTPLLGIWLTLMARHGVEDILVNTHHHSDQVTAFIHGFQGQRPARITIAQEPRLLGSGGTLWANRRFVEGTEDFLIAYADNLTRVDLTRMIQHHRKHRARGSVLTMGLFRAPDPSACGIAVLDENKRVVNFTEKPVQPESDLANAGIYVASPGLFDCFPAPAAGQGIVDLGFHVLPRLTGKMHGYLIREYLMDIGTVPAYQAALDSWLENG